MSDFVSFEDIHALVDEFKKVPAEHGLAVQPGSELDVACDATAALLLKHWDELLRDPHEDIRNDFRNALALAAFTRKIVKLRNHPDFDQLLPHVRTMVAGGGLAFNRWSSTLDKVTPKTFELLIALAAMDKGRNVMVDDPNRSKGDNPDVIATIDGIRWGFACKLLNTFDDKSPPKPKTVFNNLI